MHWKWAKNEAADAVRGKDDMKEGFFEGIKEGA